MLRPGGGHAPDAVGAVGGEAPRCGAARSATIAARHSADVSLIDGPRRLSLRASTRLYTGISRVSVCATMLKRSFSRLVMSTDSALTGTPSGIVPAIA